MIWRKGDQCKKRNAYDSAIVFYTKATEFYFKSNTWDKWVQGVNGIVDCYRFKPDIKEATRALDKWDSIARNKISVRSIEYSSLIQKRAILLSEDGEYEKSSSGFQQALNLRLSLGIKKDTAVALIYNGMGTNSYYLGNYDEAFTYYTKAVKSYDSLGMNKTVDYAMFIQNVGIIHALRGEFDEAMELFQHSLLLNTSILDKNDPKLALVYLNIGRLFNLIGKDEKALEVLTQSEEIFKLKDKKSYKLASIYLNIGAIYVNKANIEKALSYYNKALAIIQSSPTGNQSDLITALLNLGFIYEKKGDFTAASNYYLEGLKIGEKRHNSVKILRGLANINFLQVKNKEAEIFYERAINSSVQLNGPEHPETALTYFKYGEFCSITGNNAKAIKFLNQGLNIYLKAYGEKSRDVGYAYLFIANFHERNKQYRLSLDYFQKALISGFANFSDPDILKNPSPEKNNLNYIQLNMLSGKASALFSLYRSEPKRLDYLYSSAATYDLSLELMEMLRSSYQEEDSKLLIAGSEKNTLLNAIKVQVELYNQTHDKKAIEKAFIYSEKGKSSVLLSYLRDMEAKDLGKIPDKLRKLDSRLKSDIAFYNKLLFDEGTKRNANQDKINLWNTTIFELSRQHDSLIKVVETQYPAYYNLKYDNSVISINNTRKRLNPNQALVEFALSDSVVYTFAVNHDSCNLFVRSLDSTFYNNLKTIREMLIGKSFNNYSPEDFQSFTKASNNLYKVLLEPAEAIIKGKDLIVVPDADLGYLSFDILLTKLPEPKTKGYRGLSYLIKQSPISYAPSATALFEGFRNPEANTNHKVLAFAPTYENIKGVKVEELLRGKTYRDYLLPIPGAQVEVQNLKKIFKSKVFEGDEATEGSFKKNARNYSILHLAMHTIINNNNPLYSKLVFFHNADSTEDGLLNTSELFGIQLNADLAVLSACNTGTGKLEQGEGIMSLSRGFFYAGVPSIIMTSWAVEDQSGAELMSSFYKYLAEGKPKNEALRLAKLDYLETSDQLKSHPHFWAAYMNIGDISPIKDLKAPTSIFIYILYSVIGLILIGAAGFIYKRRRSG
ncbi:MAG: CHAT domain-containing protein [Bacteroidales bacterium]|nr:CHAT domain-containing protein [Bacteroidales bacterium]